eukprot:978197_1
MKLKSQSKQIKVSAHIIPIQTWENTDKSISIDYTAHKIAIPNDNYYFDHVFPPNHTIIDLFHSTAQPLIHALIQNATNSIFISHGNLLGDDNLLSISIQYLLSQPQIKRLSFSAMELFA